MEYAWLALALNDFLWIGLVFSCGLIAKIIGLPPMVGFLVSGFLLSTQNIVDENLLSKMSELGITLLLFTIGLKINIQNLLRPQIWGVAMIHTAIIVVLIGSIIYCASYFSSLLLFGIDIQNAALIAFALSFSSTVFVVKSMEDKGEMDALHGRIAIGILVIQDIFAVMFLAVSAGKMPSIWALSLILLIPFRFVLFKIIEHVGRGELLVLFGFLLAIGGAEIFELVGVKGDLGALVLGTIIAPHIKSEELVKTMLGFKDLFLLGFFLSIGLNGYPTLDTLILALLLTLFVFLKGGLFYYLFNQFKLRARTSLLTTINLSNFSEFGLIVMAIGVKNNWISNQWMVVMALVISFSFIISSILNKHANHIYSKYRKFLARYQNVKRLDFDRLLDLGNSKIAVIGMGAIGTGAYDQLIEKYKGKVVGVDINVNTVKNQRANNRNVIHGDPSDADFWDRINQAHQLTQVMLTLPRFKTIQAVVELLIESGYQGKIAAIAKFPDEIKQLKEAGVHTVYNTHIEAGAGFAMNVMGNNSNF